MSVLRCFLALCVSWGALCLPSVGHAGVFPIGQIYLGHEPSDANRVTLPHFVKQKQSDLVVYEWSLKVPQALHSLKLPTLLLPQPIQGATLSIGGEVFHEFAGSDERTFRNWYKPILISIPPNLLLDGGDTFIQVTQKGHLRGWFIAPILAGDLEIVRKWFDRYVLLSQTLSVTINVLCGLIGLFLLVLGLRLRLPSYLYSGLATVTWSLLFSLALINAIQAEQWFWWRLSLYALTGMLIYSISCFMFEIFNRKMSKQWSRLKFLYLNAGWLLFIIMGKEWEFYLDAYWTGIAVLMYVGATAWLIFLAVRDGQVKTLVPFFFHASASSFFAVHDYILQSGWGLGDLLATEQPLWVYLLLQPIYLTHLALPSFVIMALWMLAQDHLQKNKEALDHEKNLHLQREKMVADIHDGVGSRINLLLWNLRSSTPSVKQLEMDLQRCMDELRFAINPVEAGAETLNKALEDLTARLKPIFPHVDIVFDNQIDAGVVIEVDQGIQLYKAAQESINNALKHSGASKIVIQLLLVNDEVLKLRVSDNGAGIPGWRQEAQVQEKRSPTSLGLLGLKQRMLGKGGGLLINSSPRGVCVECWLPFSRTH